MTNWFQKQVTLPAAPRGCHLVTSEILQQVPEIADFKVGLMNVFIQHTSASLTINENADPDVPVDLESSFNHIAPENFPYIHTCEGPDDMPAHVKAAMIGNSVTVPINNGSLCLGTWQGVYFCEFDGPRNRKVLVQFIEDNNA